MPGPSVLPVAGAVVGHVLRNRPETHGHGVPEVGQFLGVVTASTLGERWRQVESESTVAALVDLVPPVSPDTSVGEVLSAMDVRLVDALPVRGEGQVGVVTRVGLEHFLRGERRKPRAEPPFSATEIPR